MGRNQIIGPEIRRQHVNLTYNLLRFACGFARNNEDFFPWKQYFNWDKMLTSISVPLTTYVYVFQDDRMSN